MKAHWIETLDETATGWSIRCGCGETVFYSAAGQRYVNSRQGAMSSWRRHVRVRAAILETEDADLREATT